MIERLKNIFNGDILPPLEVFSISLHRGGWQKFHSAGSLFEDVMTGAYRHALVITDKEVCMLPHDIKMGDTTLAFANELPHLILTGRDIKAAVVWQRAIDNPSLRRLDIYI